MEGIAAVAIALVQLRQLIRKPDAPGCVEAEHFTDHHGTVHTVLVPDISAGEVTVALLEAEEIASFLPGLFQQADLLADVFKARKDVSRFHAIVLRNALCQIYGNDGFYQHGILRHFAVLLLLGTEIVQQQQTHLIAGEEHIVPLGVFHGDTYPVAVRIRSQQQIRVLFPGVPQAQLHGLPNFRVGIGAGGEPAVRLFLLLHHGDVGIAQFLQGPKHRLPACPVEGRIDDGHIVGGLVPVEDRLGLHVFHKGCVNSLRNVQDPPIVPGGIEVHDPDILKNIQSFDFRKNFCRPLGGDLTAVGTVDLVAVVFAGIVRGGDHDPGAAPQLPHSKGHRRHGHQLRPNVDLHPIGSEDPGRNLGKKLAVNAAVEADGNGRRPEVLLQVVRQALGSLGNGIKIHPIGSGSDDAPQAPGAKGQIPVKGVLLLLFVHGPELFQQSRVHIRLCKPAAVFFLIVHGVLPPNIQKCHLPVEGHFLRVRRDKQAVPPAQVQRAFPKPDRAAAPNAEQGPEGFRIRPVGNPLAALRIHDHPVYFKVSAPAQEFFCHSPAIAQHPQGLPGLRSGMKIRHIQGFFQVQRTLLSVFIYPVIVIETVSQVAALLNFRNQYSGSQGVDGAGLHIEHIVRPDRHPLQILHKAAVLGGGTDGFPVRGPAQAIDQAGPLGGIQHIPHLGLAPLASLLMKRIAVIRMDLDG